PTTQYPPVGSNDGGTGHWSIVNRAGASSNSLDYQEGVTGVGGIGIPKPDAPDPASGIPLTGNDLLHRTLEYNQNGVHFDGHLWRQHPDGTPQEIFLEAKAHYNFFLKPWAGKGKLDEIVTDMHDQMDRQLRVLPPGAKLEWHFQEEEFANHIRNSLPRELQDVEVYWTP
ncbi:MAG: Tox-REase-5 domain-containing protein, partial [Pseudoclavibacter sp.]|nr:Tox-REase-5 domain-containing protein [Pseudoclavibacter sp.]